MLLILKNCKFILAPMVEQSELAWRILSRKYGSTLCYSPMINSKVYIDPFQKPYRDAIFSTDPAVDRPLIAQLCGNDPDIVLQAAKMIEPHCDAIDLNLGCPQGIAKKGHYGSWLQDEWDLIASIVKKLRENLQVPVTCKIRIFHDVEKSLKYAKMLQEAGCQALAVHGRTRDQKGPSTGLADWDQIKRIKNELTIPVFANGNILYHEDMLKCLEYTGCDGVMVAEGSLYNPSIFTPDAHYPCWEMAEEYLGICRQYSTPASMIRGHLFKMFRGTIPSFPALREQLAMVKTLDEFESVTAQLKEQLMLLHGTDIKGPMKGEMPLDSKGLKQIPSYYCQPYIREAAKSHECIKESFEEGQGQEQEQNKKIKLTQ